MKSKTVKNILDNGHTTYHSDGSKSVTYDNILDNGRTTYHSGGSKSVTSRDKTNSGFTTSGSDAGGAVIGIFILGASVICSLASLKFGFLPIIIITASIVTAFLLRKAIGESNAFLIMQPFLLFGIYRWYYVSWNHIGDLEFLTGWIGFLGILVVEVILVIFLFMFRINTEDEYGNGNGFLLCISSLPVIAAPCGVLVDPLQYVFFFFDLLLFIISLLVVIVRCSRAKHPRH